MPVIDTGRAHIAVEVEGAGPPLVLAMGIGSPLSLWPRPFVGLLVAAGFQVVLFDHRDTGRSTRFDHLGVPRATDLLLRATVGRRFEPPYTLREMAEDLRGVLDGLGLASAHVLGTSMGAMVAQELTINHPDRVRTLTSMMSTTGDKRVSRGSAGAWRAMLRRPPADPEGQVEHLTGVLMTIAGQRLPLDEAATRERARAAVERGISVEGYLRHLAAVLHSGNRTRRLAGVRVATLVVHGDADPLIPLAGGQATAATIAGARLLVIPGMGHGLPDAVHAPVVRAVAALAGLQSPEP